MRAKALYSIAAAGILILGAVELYSALTYASNLPSVEESTKNVPHSMPTLTRTGEGDQKAGEAKFHGLDLNFVPGAQPSIVHCVGDNFLPKTSAGFRSCEFRHLCWDLEEKEFVIFESEQHKHLSELMEQMPSRYARASSSFNSSVSISPTTEGRLRKGDEGQWFPRTLPVDDTGFYEMPDDVIWVPIEFPKDGTVAQTEILFDYFQPVFNLLSMFNLQNKSILFMNLGPECAIAKECYSEVSRFLSIMKRPPNIKNTFVFKKDTIQWVSGTNQNRHSQRICTNYGVGGIGGLTDHGIHKKSHGERRKDYTFVQNSGRGPHFLEFQKYVLGNLGITTSSNTVDSNLPAKMLVSASASKFSGVQFFQKQISALQKRFPADQIAIQKVTMSELSLKESFQQASESNFYISVMGDGAMPAFCMPCGATLIIFYNDNSEFVSVSKNEKSFPSKIDWDLWNNLSYLNVHWLPLSTINEQDDIELLLGIMQTQIEISELETTADVISSAPIKKDPDGTFNGLDVFYVNHPQISASHCIGENFQERSHTLKSCKFQYICLDLSTGNFSIAASGNQSLLMKSKQKRNGPYTWISTTMDSEVSVGHNVRFQENSEWFPSVKQGPFESFYELSADVVWTPFWADQPNIHNPGHLLWDYFLPFFNLLVMFGLEKHKLLVSNIDAGCIESEDTPCWKMVAKFLPMIGAEPISFQNTKNSELKTMGKRRSDLVCARYGVAGIGMLTDHGFNRHGQRFDDYRDVHNVGRGPFFFAFRNYVVKNMEVTDQLKRPYKVTFSVNSSKNPARRLDFQKQANILRQTFPKEKLHVEQVTLAELTVREQVKVATESAIFVSVVGGAASTATFLPPGSSVILFFNDVDDFVDHSPRKDFPCMIDWDFWNNASYLRVHWLPMRTMESAHDMKVFTELVKNELANLEDEKWWV